MKKRKEFYVTAELKELGFSNRMIEELLPEPVLKTNPHYKCAAPMKLYECKRVKQVMRTKRFQTMSAEYMKRRESAKKATATKREVTLTLAESYRKRLVIQVIPVEELHEEAIEARQAHANSVGIYGFCARFADEKTVKRWMLNYVRHNLSNYEELYEEFRGQVGMQQAHDMLKEYVNEQIIKIYPALQEVLHKGE